MRNGDVFGGLALVAFAAAYAWAGSDLKLTSSLGVGPGLFPMMLAGLLALLGTGIAVQAILARDGDPALDEAAEPEDAIPLRSLLLIAAGPALFAILVVPLGVVPALALAILVSAFASREMTIREAVVTTAVLVVGCVLLFRYGLGLPLALFGDLPIGME
jgi:putative tricarboxylic transport membrane protein